jgi:DNA modification methylase
LPVDALENFQGSLKKITKANLQKLKRRIIRDGINVPLFVWRDHDMCRILDGHQRLKALLSLREEGYELPLVPVAYIEAENEKDARQKLLGITSQYGEFEIEELSEWLAELDSDIADTVRIVSSEIKIKLDIETNNDDDIDDNTEQITKYGDLWELGRHRLLCGDSTDSDQVAKLMNGEKADMVFTDPPYGVDYEGKTKDKLKIKNDKIDDMYSWLYDVFTTMYGFMADGASYYVCCPAGNIHRAFQNALQDSQLPVHQGLVWLKNSMVMGHSDYHYKHEPILYGWKEGSHYFTDDRTQTSVFDVARPSRSEQHPTMKPVELIERAINNSSKVGQIVLDLFGGSGSTLIACEKLSRRCFMMEIDEHYCDVILKRWSDFTGKSPMLLDK